MDWKPTPPPEGTPKEPPTPGAPLEQSEQNVPLNEQGMAFAQSGDQPAAAPMPYGLGFDAPPLAAKPRRRSRALELGVAAIGMALLLLVAFFLYALMMLNGTLRALTTPTGRSVVPPAGSFSVIRVVGDMTTVNVDSLGVNDPSYLHGATVAHIKALAEDEGNKGILLYMNTGGGGVYESDELYRTLMSYKEQTGRPVWAYMANACASGGYYACMAADNIVANPNTTTGSIGVFLVLTDTSGLYDKLGIETVLVRSGDNKGVGTSGVPITEEQRAIYQSIVDEKYERFVTVVQDGRGLDRAAVYALADGRPFSGQQALDNGLVDELGEWEDIETAFEEKTGGKPFYPVFSNRTPLGSFIDALRSALPPGDAQAALEAAEQYPSGVPMYYMDSR